MCGLIFIIMSIYINPCEIAALKNGDWISGNCLVILKNRREILIHKPCDEIFKIISQAG